MVQVGIIVNNQAGTIFKILLAVGILTNLPFMVADLVYYYAVERTGKTTEFSFTFTTITILFHCLEAFAGFRVFGYSLMALRDCPSSFPHNRLLWR